MTGKTPNERILFGLKVKQLRQEQGLSFAKLAEQSGMSVSYLNEIEKGKKFPKGDKIDALATALGLPREELLSSDLGRHLAPVQDLLRSNFLSELPLDLFGIELSKVAEIIAGAPTRVGAFISTLLELSRSYNVREENFYFGALRAYLELHENYFEFIEEAVSRFIEETGLGYLRPLDPARLAELLEDRYDYCIVPNGLDEHAELRGLRSVFLPDRRRLLLESDLGPMQRAFLFGKELAFNYLELKERAHTSSLIRSRVFDEVINHSRAIYFSVALHLPLQPFIADLEAFFRLPRWDGAALLGMMQRYAASPEMFYQRLTNVLPRYFNLPELFFLRFIQDTRSGQYTIDRELHLNRRHRPHSSGLFEHYCRRWVSITSLVELAHSDEPLSVRVQWSHFHGTSDEYLCLTIARRGYPTSEHNVSVTLGLLINERVREVVRWLDDPAIGHREVNTTCERCPLTDCTERAAPPTVVAKRERYRNIQAALRRLLEEAGAAN